MAWVPLEANPELFTAWCERLGLDTQRYAFHDVFGLDEELLAMVPQPVQLCSSCFRLRRTWSGGVRSRTR